jgi:glycosyltransferase involved in cell wall biosynthesis
MGKTFFFRKNSPETDSSDRVVLSSTATTAFNLLKMSAVVAFGDARKLTNPVRVYMKSYARFRNYGWDGMSSRLVKEYCRATGRSVSIPLVDYSDWIQSCEPGLFVAPCPDAGILVSIIMPVFNTDAGLLRRAIASVLGQTYHNWELCICDDGSTLPDIRRLIEEFASQDFRIKTVFRNVTGHISAASNSALVLATGDYVTFIDHDDEFSPHALNEIVSVIGDDNYDFIYSDEDKIGDNGGRFSPHFKPEYSEDLLLSQNYISHLTAIRRDLVVQVEGFREGYDGSQDYDLYLRCLSQIPSYRVCHIPKILYHWRVGIDSTALDPLAKEYTSRAGVKALTSYLIDNGITGEAVLGVVPNTYRVIRPISDPPPLVSLVIPTRDNAGILKSCINSILQNTDYENYEIIVVNNQSVENLTFRFFEEISGNSRIKVIDYEGEFNFSAINNKAVTVASGSILGLINNDIEVISPGWMTEMVSHAVREEIGCVGAKLYYPDDTIQHAGVILGIGGVAGHGHKYLSRYDLGYFSRLGIVHNVSAVTAACLFVKKSIYEQVGGMDQEHLAVAFNDVDLCLKVIEAGYRNLLTPWAQLYHFESKSRGKDDTVEKKERFKREVLFMKKKWGDTLQNDPYYSPHLTLQYEQFQIRSKSEH